MSLALSSPKQKTLQDPDLKEHLQRLRQTNNLTNWYYLLRSWLFLALVIGGAIWFDLWRREQDLSWLVSVPVFVVAIILVGAGQHQLSGLAHEGVHHILFRHRKLNEFISDWFCLFPLFSSTHHYRLQHLAHHQFVNDPLRDPDVSQLQTSGHWLDFPLSPREFMKLVLKQLWLPNLARFILVRAKYNATGTDKNPYMPKGIKQPKGAVRIGLLYLVSMLGSLCWMVSSGDAWPWALIPTGLWMAMMVTFAILPHSKFHQSRLHPVIPQRVMSQLRLTFITLLFGSLAWIQLETNAWAWSYYALLWIVPLFTSFSFFMILRQWVQHGNGDRGWLTNTRVFFVSRFLNFSVFPMGQDYHLPHHVYATVPHYNLAELHQILSEYPEYQEQVVVVHGYFASPENPKVHPTVIDVLGPDYAAKEFRGVHIDNTVLDDCKVAEKDEIIQEGAKEKERLESGS